MCYSPSPKIKRTQVSAGGNDAKDDENKTVLWPKYKRVVNGPLFFNHCRANMFSVLILLKANELAQGQMLPHEILET